MRIVLDTNVLIAASLKGGLSEDILKLPHTRLITLLTSKDILEELERKLKTKFKWTDRDIHLFTSYIKKIAEVVKIAEKVTIIKRDPGDNKILECALSGNADLIVSADLDLIKLKKIRGIAIIHPKTLSWTFPEYFKRSKKSTS